MKAERRERARIDTGDQRPLLLRGDDLAGHRQARNLRFTKEIGLARDEAHRRCHTGSRRPPRHSGCDAVTPVRPSPAVAVILTIISS